MPGGGLQWGLLQPYGLLHPFIVTLEYQVALFFFFFQVALLKSQLMNVKSSLGTKSVDHTPKCAFSAVTGIWILLCGLMRPRSHDRCSELAERSERYLGKNLSLCPHKFKYYHFLCVPLCEKLGESSPSERWKLLYPHSRDGHEDKMR